MSMEVSMAIVIINVKNLSLMSVTESKIVSVVNELSLKKSTNYIGLYMKIIRHVIPNIAKTTVLYKQQIFLGW